MITFIVAILCLGTIGSCDLTDTFGFRVITELNIAASRPHVSRTVYGSVCEQFSAPPPPTSSSENEEPGRVYQQRAESAHRSFCSHRNTSLELILRVRSAPFAYRCSGGRKRFKQGIIINDPHL